MIGGKPRSLYGGKPMMLTMPRWSYLSHCFPFEAASKCLSSGRNSHVRLRSALFRFVRKSDKSGLLISTMAGLVARSSRRTDAWRKAMQKAIRKSTRKSEKDSLESSKYFQYGKCRKMNKPEFHVVQHGISGFTHQLTGVLPREQPQSAIHPN